VYPDQRRVPSPPTLLQGLKQVRRHVEVADAAAVLDLREIGDPFGDFGVAAIGVGFGLDLPFEVDAGAVILRIVADVQPARAFRIHLRLRS
jgi:hypothetical protein